MPNKKRLLILVINMGCPLTFDYIFYGFNLKNYASHQYKVICSLQQWMENKDLDYHNEKAKEFKNTLDKNIYEVHILEMIK